MCCRGLLLPSQHQNLITGLNLLRLLVQNRIAEFHTELELIPQEVMELLAYKSLCQRLCRILQSLAVVQIQQEAHIKHATQLEQQLMEGAYNKVLSAKSNVPDQSYLYFMDKLISTVRYIMSCNQDICTTDLQLRRRNSTRHQAPLVKSHIECLHHAHSPSGTI